MGHQDGSTDTDSDKIRPVSAQKIHQEKNSRTHIYTRHTDICPVFDSESLGIRDG